jgi:putative transcriptional regulator
MSASEPDVEQLTGRLLVATPSLADPNFARTVVLVLDHDHSGTLGVVLNRPTDVPVGEVLPDWTSDVSPPGTLFGGGPVATDSALAVGVVAGPTGDEESVEGLIGWRSMFGRVGLVDLDTPVEVVSGALQGLRIFAGYAGWSSGQLEGEIEQGAWLIVDGHDADLTTTAPARLWSDVLRRQDGDVRFLATYPADPVHN